MATESRPPESLSEPESQIPAEPGAVEAPLAGSEAHAPSVHEALLETVSPDALATAAGQTVSEAPAETQPVQAHPVEAPETTEAADAAEPAPVMQPPEALEAVPDAAVPDVTAEPETAAGLESIPEPISVAAIETTSAALAATTAPEAILRPTEASLDVIGEITHANATILAFLQSEGSAAMAHWRSLSGARTPADAIRIQVDEMQRAADASLTCFSALARRAGRLAAGIGRT